MERASRVAQRCAYLALLGAPLLRGENNQPMGLALLLLRGPLPLPGNEPGEIPHLRSAPKLEFSASGAVRNFGMRELAPAFSTADESAVKVSPQRIAATESGVGARAPGSPGRLNLKATGGEPDAPASGLDWETISFLRLHIRHFRQNFLEVLPLSTARPFL